MLILCTKRPAIWVCAGRGPMQLVEAANGVNFGRRNAAIAFHLVPPKTKNDITSPHALKGIMISLLQSAVLS